MKRTLAAALALSLVGAPASAAENGAAAPPGISSTTAGSPLPAQSPAPDEARPLVIPPALPNDAQRQLREQLNGRPEQPSPAADLIATEALFAVNSFLASIAPRIYGAAATILLPAGTSGMNPGPERTAAVLMLEGLALYDLFGADPHKMSEGAIFRVNFIAWHGIMLANAAVHHAAQKRASERKKIVIVPLKRGAAVATAWRFQ